VLAAGAPLVRALVRDCLRHWALEYRVDGFVVLNAENLAQVWKCGKCVCGCTGFTCTRREDPGGGVS
jgi:hypothetical protein